MSSTFHLHGTIKPEYITEKYIETGAIILYAGLEKGLLSRKEKDAKKEEVQSARADFSEFMARKALNKMRVAPVALGVDDLERLAAEAAAFLKRSRDRSGLSEEEKGKRVAMHAKSIDDAMDAGLKHSLALDMTRAKNKSDELTAGEREMLVQRTESVVGVLMTRALTDSGRTELKNMHTDICITSLMKSLSAGQKQLGQYKFNYSLFG